MVLERAHKLVHLFSPFVRVVLLCAVDFSPTSPNSGAKIVGGFLRSEKPIFLFFSLFSASFSCCFFLFRWRSRKKWLLAIPSTALLHEQPTPCTGVHGCHNTTSLYELLDAITRLQRQMSNPHRKWPCGAHVYTCVYAPDTTKHPLLQCYTTKN